MTTTLPCRLRRIVLCLPLLAAGCAGLSASPAPVLVGSEWRVEQMAGREVPAGIEITLTFPESGRVAGKAACNRFFGSYTQTQQQLSFSQMGSTRMACVGPAAELETVYLAALQKAVRFEMQGPRMTLHLSGGQPALRLSRTR